MLDEVSLNTSSERLAVNHRTADTRFGQPERLTHLAEQTTGIGLVQRRVERPVRREVVDGRHQSATHRRAARRRQDWRVPKRGELPKKRAASGDNELRGTPAGGFEPPGAGLRPCDEPERPEGMRWSH